MKLKILAHTPNLEKVVAMAGKLCYAGCNIDELEENLTEEEVAKFVDMLVRLGHHSPLEHVSFTFAVEGISRITEQQLTRHRMASYSIQSGRYVERDGAEFSSSEMIDNNRYCNDIYDDILWRSKNAYEDIKNDLVNQQIFNFVEGIDEVETDGYGSIYEYMEENHPKLLSTYTKKAIENARMVFPNSLQTKIIFTMNLRSLINFFEHRCCLRSQDEIREMANLMLTELKKVSPILFNRLGANCKTKDYCPEGAMQCSQFKGIIPTLAQLRKSHLIVKQKENK